MLTLKINDPVSFRANIIKKTKQTYKEKGNNY